MKLGNALTQLAILALVCAGLNHSAWAHDGRRFTIEVVDSRLQAQGVNTGPDDGAPAIRPYLNSIHDHWSNVANGGAVASLPGFDLPPSAATTLLNHRIDIELLRVRRWVAPPMMPPIGTVPSLTPLASGELLTVTGPTGVLDSTGLGATTLLEQVTFGGTSDIDLVYQVNTQPQGVIHVLDVRLVPVSLAGGASVVLPSDPIHILLSPDGSTPHERLHHAALYLESYLAAIPEPTGLVLGVLGAPLLLARRRTRVRRHAAASTHGNRPKSSPAGVWR